MCCSNCLEFTIWAKAHQAWRICVAAWNQRRIDVRQIFSATKPCLIQWWYRFALQFALLSGANVIITSSSDEKLKICAKIGADYGSEVHLINYKTNLQWGAEVQKIVRLHRSPGGVY